MMRRQLDLYSAPVREEETSSPTSSDNGSERQRLELSLPGSASTGRAEPQRPTRSTARERDKGRSETPTPSPSSRSRLADRASSHAPKSRSSASNRTASLPAHRVNAGDSDAAKSGKPLCCDKCDGPHVTDDCPHFKGSREKHVDAWTSYGKGKPGAGSSMEIIHIVRNARVVPQPGDGSCLFHSLSYGLGDRSTASSLRREICRYVESHPDTVIADTQLKDWVRYDSGGTVQSYASKMSSGSWGGGIEMAALTKMKSVNVHVYEKCEEGYKRISSFDHPSSKKTISVLYQGRMHYDAIDV